MEKIIYLVIPCYNEVEVIEETARRTKREINRLAEKKLISNESKICFVNDGSMDNTWQLILKLCKKDCIFVGINLSKNFGHQNAILAGMSEVWPLCDAVITMDADLQQDITKIESFIDKYYDGNEIVYGIRTSRRADSFFKKITANSFYTIMGLLGCEMLPHHADYRLISSKAIQELMNFKEINLFLRGIIPMVGFQSDIVYYQVYERFAGKSKYTLGKMISLALNGITSLTIKPIRFITILGSLLFLFSIILSVYFFASSLMGNFIQEYTTILLSLWFIGGIQLISIGIIGEYIGKIYLETKQRPRYIIQEIFHNKEKIHKDH
ncbi:glycosyltransferase family 2 protein [Anaerotignum sp.]|uniref:glycosyltransferase family 2 protein n=1 Tax=Anaerotignum sp. TaxID=2039241 RepID=UPI00331A88DA